jgi:hypothetical protein
MEKPEILLRSTLLAPFRMDAVVVEEDTALILSAEPHLSLRSEHPIRLMTDMVAQRFADPGSIVVKKTASLCLCAIVHDFDQDPSFKDQWVTSAIDESFVKCQEYGIRHLTMQVLGATYGPRSLDWFLELLNQRLSRCSGMTPDKVLILD